MFDYIDGWKEEGLKKQAADLRAVCNLNLSAVLLKLEDFADAKSCCKKVPEKDGQNVKALFRLAQAEVGLKEYMSAMAQCKKLLEVESANQDARALYKKASVLQKEEDRKSKGMFMNMSKAFGKLGGDERSREEKENRNKNIDDDDDYMADDGNLKGDEMEVD